MANQSIQIRNIDGRISRVSIELSMDILRQDEKSVRLAFSNLSDEIQSKFEKQDEFEISKNEIVDGGEPASVKQIIDKKTKSKKQKSNILQPANEAEAVHDEISEA